MGNQKLSILLDLSKQKFSSGLKSANSELRGFVGIAKSMRGILAGIFVGFSTAAFIKELKQVRSAYLIQQKAVDSLSQSMVNQGIYSDSLLSKYKKLASRLQQVTNFGDEATLQAMSLLQAYAGQNEITQELTESIMDFASAQKMDLKAAVALVGKTIGSSTNALTRYGIELESGLSPSEKMAKIQEKLSEKFGGSARALYDSDTGLSMAIGDLREEIGKFLSSDINKFLDFLTKATNKVKNFFQAINDSKKTNLQQNLLETEKRIQSIIDKYPKGAERKNMSFLDQDILKQNEKSLKWLKTELGEIDKLTNKKTQTNTTNADKKNKKDSALKSYEPISSSIAGQKFELESRKELESKLRQIGLDSKDEYYKEALNLGMEYHNKIRAIEISEAKNKQELILKTQELYKSKWTEAFTKLDMQEKAEALERVKESARYEAELKKETEFEILQYKTKLIEKSQEKVRKAAEKEAEKMQRAWENAFNLIMDHSLTWKERMKAIMEEVGMAILKSQLKGSLGNYSNNNQSSFWGDVAGGIAKGLSYDTGGIIPGNFSQATPIIAHGSEMVLNPSQQGNLFKMLNNGSGMQSQQQSQQPVVVLNMNLQSLDPSKAGEVFKDAYKNTIKPMIVNDITSNNQMKTAVRGAMY